ncbi:MAG: DegT/DnrJ/EryC1/StrS family aminotransferase [Planctomycetaceae bacterium]
MIPVCEPLMTADDLEMVNDCIRSGWISSAGKYIAEFEARWSSYCGMRHGISVSNGTSALQIAVELLDLQPGDEVIVPCFTIISVVRAVIQGGGIPVLVDSNADDWQMNVEQIADRITPRTRAIIVVHTYGHPADMSPIMQLADRHGLNIIEDAAEAHGAEYRQLKCGGIGDISVFSFYANKLITTGEGGMVLVQDDTLADRARRLRNLCFESGRRFLHHELGHNFRLTNLQAAIGVSQLNRIEGTIARKREIASLYKSELQDATELVFPVEQVWARSVYWVSGFLISSPRMEADDLGGWLGQHGVETRPFFLGMHEQPVFQQRGMFRGQKYPVAERLAKQGLYLPNGLTLTDAQIFNTCQLIKDCLRRSF